MYHAGEYIVWTDGTIKRCKEDTNFSPEDYPQAWETWEPEEDAQEAPAMSETELIGELTDICIRQAEIIKAQAYVLEQLGAQVKEEEALKEQNRLRAIAGEWEV